MTARKPGLQDALNALRAPKGKPTDADRPRPTPLPGRKPKQIAGQLDLEGRETPRLDELADEERSS